MINPIYGAFSAQAQPIGGTKSSTAAHLGGGHYRVNFKEPFSNTPAVVVSPQTDNLGNGYVVSVSLTDVSESGFSVFIQNLSNPPENKDVAFSFVAALCN